MDNAKKVKADVLVIGGGIAGLFTAIKASEQGADVILADKGFAGSSGQSPYAQSTMVFNPEWGHNLKTWMDYTVKCGEYIVNQKWLEQTFLDSYARYQDMLAWGIKFKQNDDGTVKRIPTPPGVTEFIEFDPEGKEDYGQTLRKQALKTGVRIFDRTMICELLMDDQKVAGAVGISCDEEQVYAFVTKTIVMCTGGCGFKPYTYAPMIQLTCDGEAMAYRAGADILGKEFVDTHSARMDLPVGIPKMLRASMDIPAELRKYTSSGRSYPETDCTGKEFVRPEGASQYLLTYLERELAAHAGKAPCYTTTPDGPKPVMGASCLGMSLRKADGIWPVDESCESTIPGLFAAGDSLGTMENGAAYAVLGSSTMGGAVTGTVAGINAAKKALETGEVTIDDSKIQEVVDSVIAPLKRTGGYGPRWTTQLIQNMMIPYFISYIKEEKRLTATLTLVKFLEEHIVPRIFAKDFHELRLAHEAKSIILSAEMRLQSALFRTESRGNHYREDYPARDDKNWRAWTKISNHNGEMELTKVPIPEEWGPDLSVPYETRYPFRFPGEEELISVANE